MQARGAGLVTTIVELLEKNRRAGGTVALNILRDREHIRPRGLGDDYLHEAGLRLGPFSSDFKRRKASSSGMVRPAFASASPRARASSSAFNFSPSSRCLR